MAVPKSAKHPVALLKIAVSTLLTRPAVFFPFVIIAFIQLVIFEVIFFAPRYPLNAFFGPLIEKMEGEIFLHYPFNFLVLTKWFQNTFLQSAIFIAISSLFIGMAVAVINMINNDETVKQKLALRKAGQSYVHLFTAALITVLAMLGMSHLHGLVIKRAMQIGATAGVKLLIKKAVLLSAPYVNLVLAVFVTTLFIFVIPIIIVEKKKIFAALVQNFKLVGKTFFPAFVVILLPALLYIPIILLRMASPILQRQFSPEILAWIAILGVVFSVIIDAVHYTAMTTFYLLQKEEQ